MARGRRAAREAGHRAGARLGLRLFAGRPRRGLVRRAPARDDQARRRRAAQNPRAARRAGAGAPARRHGDPAPAAAPPVDGGHGGRPLRADGGARRGRHRRGRPLRRRFDDVWLPGQRRVPQNAFFVRRRKTHGVRGEHLRRARARFGYCLGPGLVPPRERGRARRDPRPRGAAGRRDDGRPGGGLLLVCGCEGACVAQAGGVGGGGVGGGVGVLGSAGFDGGVL
mmetsp:Transcript_20859/g.64186  ORF Transcript_20859/g.64186 Transcript_20859/m.64186 type:complete len:225 (-) Transcript_20859:26-700(-)